jgi:hypothetical protein
LPGAASFVLCSGTVAAAPTPKPLGGWQGRPARVEVVRGWDDEDMDGRAYLAKLITDRLAAGHRQPPANRGGSLDLAHIRGVAVGLVAAGALAQDEMETIIADLEQTLERLGWLTRVHASVSASTDAATPPPVAVRREMVINSIRERRQWQVDPSQLRQIIPLIGRTVALAPATANLVSVELWTTMVVLRLAFPDPSGQLPRERMFAARRRWRGWDDAGTQYRQDSTGGWGGHGVCFEDVILEPGVPDGVRALTLCADATDRPQRLEIILNREATPD